MREERVKNNLFTSIPTKVLSIGDEINIKNKVFHFTSFY